MKEFKDSKKPAKGLKQALGLREREAISLVGGGGKTTLMFCLAKELAALGHHLITTTTTKIREPGGADTPFLSLGESHEAILDKVHRFGHITVASHRVAGGKLQGISRRQADALWESGEMDYLIIEADGAAQRPLKAPESCEPVIPSCTGVVVGDDATVCIGVAVADEKVHGDQMARDLLGRPRETGLAVLLQEADTRLIGAPDPQGAAVEANDRQIVEPGAGIGRIRGPGPFHDLGKDALHVPSGQSNPPIHYLRGPPSADFHV